MRTGAPVTAEASLRRLERVETQRAGADTFGTNVLPMVREMQVTGATTLWPSLRA